MFKSYVTNWSFQPDTKIENEEVNTSIFFKFPIFMTVSNFDFYSRNTAVICIFYTFLSRYRATENSFYATPKVHCHLSIVPNPHMQNKLVINRTNEPFTARRRPRGQSRENRHFLNWYERLQGDSELLEPEMANYIER